ncbi:hypothetical protein D3C78_1510940 [compost metagenome]
MPNHRITSGISARCGTLRIICTELSSKRSPHFDRPVMKPSVRPMPPPMVKPSAARQPLIARCVQISPLRTRLTPASMTAMGAGRIRVDNQPADTLSCHTASNNTGNAQGARLWMIFFMTVPQLWDAALGRMSLATISPNGLT